MRQVKYRVWDSELNVWITDALIGPDGFIWTNEVQFHPRRKYALISFFTGLYDKNGKEIYEGDAVKAIGHFEEIYLVEYESKYNAGFSPFSTCTIGGGPECERVNPEYCEIIGNIYENPELLKTE